MLSQRSPLRTLLHDMTHMHADIGQGKLIFEVFRDAVLCEVIRYQILIHQETNATQIYFNQDINFS